MNKHTDSAILNPRAVPIVEQLNNSSGTGSFTDFQKSWVAAYDLMNHIPSKLQNEARVGTLKLLVQHGLIDKKLKVNSLPAEKQTECFTEAINSLFKQLKGLKVDGPKDLAKTAALLSCITGIANHIGDIFSKLDEGAGKRGHCGTSTFDPHTGFFKFYSGNSPGSSRTNWVNIKTGVVYETDQFVNALTPTGNEMTMKRPDGYTVKTEHGTLTSGICKNGVFVGPVSIEGKAVFGIRTLFTKQDIRVFDKEHAISHGVRNSQPTRTSYAFVGTLTRGAVGHGTITFQESQWGNKLITYNGDIKIDENGTPLPHGTGEVSFETEHSFAVWPTTVQGQFAGGKLRKLIKSPDL